MRITELLNGFSELSKLYAQHPKLRFYSGFSADFPASLLHSLIKKGWWSVLYFGYEPTRKVQYGLRIMPKEKCNEWPVVATFQGEHGGTFAPNLASFFELVSIEKFSNSSKLFSSFRDQWSQVIEQINPLSNFFGWDKSIKYLEKYLENKENAPVSNLDWKSKNWAKVTIELSNTDATTKFFHVVEQMRGDKNLIPSVSLEDFGIWKTWVANLIAARMVLKAQLYPSDKVEEVLWRSFCQSTGFDPCDIQFSSLPDRSYDPYMGAFEIANVLGASYFNCTDEIKSDPLFPAIEQILQQGKLAYSGHAHLEAGKALRQTDNQAKRAWNAFVSTGYWAGRNEPQLVIPAWEEAIDLCDSQGWEDAKQALHYQHDLYMKKK